MRRKWQAHDEETLRAYAIFNSPDGQRVLQHWLDNVYCDVYEGNNQIDLAHHNGRRSAIHEILQNIHHAENPSATEVKVQTEVEETNGRSS